MSILAVSQMALDFSPFNSRKLEALEWDVANRLSDVTKHGLNFACAARLFDPGGQPLTAPGRRKYNGKYRFIGFGRLASKVVAVCRTVRR